MGQCRAFLLFLFSSTLPPSNLTAFLRFGLQIVRSRSRRLPKLLSPRYQGALQSLANKESGALTLLFSSSYIAFLFDALKEPRRKGARSYISGKGSPPSLR